MTNADFTAPPVALADMTGLTPLAATTLSPDPQVVYRELWKRWGPVAPVELEPGLHAWLVMSYPEIVTVLRQEHLFARDAHHWRDFAEGKVPPDSGLGPLMFPRDSAYFTDGARHRQLRAPLDESIDTIDQRGLHRAVRGLCTELIAGFAGRGEADMVAEYADVVPTLTLAHLFGLDADQGRDLHRAMITLMSGGADAQAASGRMVELLAQAVRTRQERPAQDLTSFFIKHPNLTNEAEIIQTMGSLIAAGTDSTTAWIAQALRLMLTDRRFAGRLRGGRLGIDDALNEVLWRTPPSATIGARFALRDTELAGQPIWRGDALVLAVGAANLDPDVHPTAGIEVGNHAHLAWGAGPHACPAQLPARLITQTAVDTALHQLPDVRLAIPLDEVPIRPSSWSRSPAALPVTFTPTTV